MLRRLLQIMLVLVFLFSLGWIMLSPSRIEAKQYRLRTGSTPVIVPDLGNLCPSDKEYRGNDPTTGAPICIVRVGVPGPVGPQGPMGPQGLQGTPGVCPNCPPTSGGSSSGGK